MEMMELKTKATELGLDFKGNISKTNILKLISDAESDTAEDSKQEDVKVKVIITPRDDEEKEGYVGFNGYTASYQFDEEIELPTSVVEFIKSKGGYTHKGGKKKWQSRFLVEYV